MQVAQELYPDEFGIWEEIRAFRDSLPREIKVLQPDDVEQLSALAEKVEEGRRRGAALKVVVNKLVRAPEHGLQIHRGHANTLVEQYHKTLTEDVHTRVCELRAQLAKLPADKQGRVLTVTRSPYRIVRVPCTLGEKEQRAIRWLYLMFDRFAWRARLGPIETKSFRLAQERFRFALATGVILADDGTVISNKGEPRAFLQRSVRLKLRWVSEVSLMLEEVFETFYRPASNLPDQDRFHIFAERGLPYAADVINFLNAARNEILTVMNQLFESAGFDPCELVQGHKFPDGVIPDGRVPEGELMVAPEVLCEQHSVLRSAGVNHTCRTAA